MTDLVERLEAWARRESASGIAEDAINEIERLRAEVEQQRLELGITGDACGALDSEVKQLRAEVADLREECAAYRGLQADQANARCELLEMLKLERARVAELEAALENANHLRSALENSVAPLRTALQRIHDDNYDLTMLEIMGIAKKALSGLPPMKESSR